MIILFFIDQKKFQINSSNSLFYFLLSSSHKLNIYTELSCFYIRLEEMQDKQVTFLISLWIG
jgi:hypothetical protein